MSRTVGKRTGQGMPQSGFAEEGHPFAHHDIIRGIEARRVKSLMDRGVLNAEHVYRLIPARTFNRRLANGEKLKTSEADAIARLLRVIEAAVKTFGDAEFARKYLVLPNPALKDRVPIEMAETDAGAREVEAALSRFAHGDYI
jgi:putative toxin-antitoxin system antitoxin component (TIGR02293 family)